MRWPKPRQERQQRRPEAGRAKGQSLKEVEPEPEPTVQEDKKPEWANSRVRGLKPRRTCQNQSLIGKYKSEVRDPTQVLIDNICEAWMWL